MKSLTKAEKQIKVFKDKGLKFKYNFDYDVMYKVTFAINIDGYSLTDILSNLREDEVITFLINDGKEPRKSMQQVNIYYDDNYRESIYWKHEQYSDLVRIKTNYSDFADYITNNAKIIQRRNKIFKIKSNVKENN